MAFFKGAAKEAQRAMHLMQQREKEKKELEIAKKKLEAEMKIGNITNKVRWKAHLVLLFQS